jgi:type I restriction enzyme S subunit
MVWDVKKIDDICHVEYGTRIVQKRDGGTIYPVYGGGGETFFTDKSNREDCLVIARFAMSEKCTRFVKGKFFLNDSGLTVNPKDKNELSQEFLNYQILHLNDYIFSLGRGTAQKNLDMSKFRKIDIHFPKSIDEQKRIVAILNKAFEGIVKAKENTERNLANACDLFESIRETEIVDLTKKMPFQKLGNWIDIKHGFAFKSQFFAEQGNYVLLTPGNFYEKGGYRDRGEKQKYFIGDVSDEFILNKGDLLIAMTEQAAGLLGSPIIVPESGRFLHNQRLGLITYKENKKIHTKFLFHLFNTHDVRKQIHLSGSGVKVRHTSPKKVKEITVKIPDLAQQITISKKLDLLDSNSKKLTELYRNRLIALQELKKSILQKAFNGELTEAST